MQEESDLLLEIASLKRQAPVQAAERQREAYKRAVEQEEALMREAEENAGAKDVRDVEFDLKPLERQADVEAAWNRGVNGLIALKRDMGDTAARMERAKKAGEYVLAER